nr:reverse transcriptase domain-containing protein [Tanacetum cinerariifolium]
MNNSEMAAEGPADLPVPDLRTMEELCQPSLNGRGGPIAPIAIKETNFGLKNDMIQQVQNSCQFHGLPGDDANKHLDKFPHVTQRIKVNGVTDDALRTFMKRHPEKCYDLIENMTAHHNDWDTSAQRITPKCETCGGPHSSSIVLPTLAILKTYMLREPTKANDAILKNIQTNMTSLTKSNLELKNMFGQFMKMNTASSLGLGTLLVERETEATKDTVHSTNNGSIEDVQPSVVLTESPILTSELVNSPIIEPVASPVSALRPNQRPSIPYPSRLQDQKLQRIDRLISHPDGVAEDVFIKVGTFHYPTDFIVVDFDANLRVPRILRRSFLKIERALIDVFECELTLCVGKEAITFNLDQTLRYSANYNDMTVNRIDVTDMACEEYSQEVLSFYDVIESGNLTPYYDPIVSTTSPTLTPFRNSDFLLEEVDAFLALEDDPTSPEVDQSYELKIREAKSDKSLIDEPPEVELKDLPPLLEYVFLEGDDKLPVIIAKDLSVEEKTALITVLKSHKRAIAWKLSDIKGIDPEFCTRKILIEEDFEPAIQHQRRVNPKIHDVIKQEVLKLLDAGLIYPISDKKMLKRCEDTNLCLNWEKSHFMVKEEGDMLLLEEFLNDDPSSPPFPPQELEVVEPNNKKSSIDEPPVVELKD